MLKPKNIIPTITVTLVLFIIYASTIPGYIKLVLAIFSITFLIPIAREIMFENGLRKIKVAFYTALITSLGIMAVGTITDSPPIDIEYFMWFLILFFFSSLGIFCYGIPASIIAELVSKRFVRHRALISGLIHIGFGLLTAIFGLSYYLSPGVFIIPALYSGFFFLIDEVTRRRMKKT
ncbi:hypothetical protein AF332_04970 [Sporosarcina globispora]|uniref:Uncharacterized protein n=1 Tax=Sporosarcina globispora TaxID=1459 RepID=A0A0M0G8L1_SPOGL|nr:hypothetical protein [Sporosarcina globispora]KON86240.1 hypothetical protein AF332_04970 [Sporosarcina globispora]